MHKSQAKTTDGRKKRTNLQNNSMHKYERELAEQLNDSGYWVKKTLMVRPQIDLPWTKELVHELLWKTVLEAMTGKTSSTDMDTVNPSEVHAVISEHILNLTDGNIYIPWPCEENREL